ncbi:hypothetical protein [Winogradskyella bathintestinalis]|uniref:DUF1700 domain-containing protein n=1 Tax=Winogradskyella bathintestinalis TaxID=3035208 RepID=A0ABT7ZRG7_9FLAO|nr:hypothetical protein [Winogradskyella bathintestinalis]MDN3491601.1 hypothetical protein [Winogradskyella bathintestinalis]
MKLTKEDIQFIDNYLENSEVIYVDIRMEMIDHVASDIENRIEAGDTRSFYDIFKDYMVENKAQLLDDNKQFLKSADKKIWKTFVKQLKNPLTPLLFLASCIGFDALFQNYSIETFRQFISIIPLVGFTGFILTYVVYQGVRQNKRFSVVERLAFPFLAFYQLPNIFISRTKDINGTSDLFWTIGSASIALTLMLILVIISIKLFVDYESRFKSVV